MNHRNPLLPRGKLSLTPAEQRVYDMKDKSVAEIARLLGIGPKTVESIREVLDAGVCRQPNGRPELTERHVSWS